MTYLSEDEQRRRVRELALKLEEELLARRGHKDDLFPVRTERELSDVRLTLEHVGRKGGYLEHVAIEEANKRRIKRTEEQLERERKRKA